MDPCKVIKQYESCKIHANHSKLDCFSLGEIYRFITNTELENAHNSLVDCKAQTTVVTDKAFLPFIDKTNSIRLVSEIFSHAEKREMLREAEPSRPVHDPWKELIPGESFQWNPPRKNMYLQHSGGGRLGPSNGIKSAAMKNKSILDIFLFLIPLSLVHKIATYSNYYAYTEPVKLSETHDKDGNRAKKKMYVKCKR